MTYRRLLRYFALAVGAMCACQFAVALSFEKTTVNLSIPFSDGSSVVPEASAAEIADQAACIESMWLEIVIVIAYGDGSPSRLDDASQMKLAAERASALRTSFMGLGIPDRRIYTEARADVPPPYFRHPNRPEGGVAIIEYIGVCRGGTDCPILCKGQRQ
jgi:hypothetical protein